MFTNSVKRAREISKFHVAVVQRRLRNVQKSVMHVQSCCLTNLNLSGLFAVLVTVAVVVALVSLRNRTAGRRGRQNACA